MDATAANLHRALVAAYRPYLEKVAAAHEMEQALTDGEAWLAEALRELLSLPFVRQRRGPLEVFQESLRFPTAVLTEAGVTPAERPATEVAALPGDIYGLAPPSSQDLGEDVWRAHLEWGVTKAAALTTVCWFGRDLADRSKIEDAATRAGRRLVVTPTDVARCAKAVIDLEYPGSEQALDMAVAAQVPTVAYGPHVGTASLRAAAAKGAVAVPRSKFFADPGLHVT
jgi:hypothetical protein